jgi:cytochrome c-type biogenesis protein CcmH
LSLNTDAESQTEQAIQHHERSGDNVIAARDPMTSTAFTAASTFWLLAGILIGVAAAVTFGRLWNSEWRHGTAWSIAAMFAFGAAAVVLYLYLGRPDSLTSSATRAHTETSPAPDSKSMEAVAAGLAARLSRDGGSNEDWELLAQSYEFMGRAADAELARAHRVADVAARESDASDFISAANDFRRQRNYAAARAEFERAIAAGTMTADSWADYADTLASAHSGDGRLKPAAQAIDRALALDPSHAKALWLKASLAHEEKRYGDALKLWRQLRSLVDADESDARLIDANIAETLQLLSQSPTSPAAVAKVSITGTVNIDSKLAARIAPGSTLFIYAKSIDSPGPPLAVLRMATASWPMRFTLDDSLAMLPGRNLSSAREVLIEARLSKSGLATAAPGDLQAAGTRIDVRSGKSVRLQIDREVS